MLVLEVGLAVVTDDPVGVGRRRRRLIRARNLTLVHVPQALVQTVAQIHIANWVDSLGELDGAGQLAVPVAPVVLNALQVPLVHDDDDLVALGAVNLFKELLVLLVDEDLLELGEVGGRSCYIPVHQVLIHALFSEGRCANGV